MRTFENIFVSKSYNLKFFRLMTAVMMTFSCTVSFLKQFVWMDKSGDYSDDIYLYRSSSQQFIAWAFPSFSGTQNRIMSMTIALLVGVVSWLLIEKKALNLKKLLLKKSDTMTINSSLKTQGASI